jgi:hypothetical protein
MSRKLVAVFVIVAVAGAVGLAMRSANRADAANGNCYSDAQGPATPTVCQ